MKTFGQKSGPVSDDTDKHPSIDEVKVAIFRGGIWGGRAGKGPRLLDVCKCEVNVWWQRWEMRGNADVNAKDVGGGMLGSEGASPDAGAGADVEDLGI